MAADAASQVRKILSREASKIFFSVKILVTTSDAEKILEIEEILHQTQGVDNVYVRSFKDGQCIIAALIIFAAQVESATPIKNHPRIAVAEFSNKAITSEGFGDQDYSSATEYAIYQLSVADWFDLIDYEQMVAIARMHSMYRSGMFDASSAPVLGKFLAAEYILVGSVTVRFVDVETLKIVSVGMGTGTSVSTRAEISFSPFRNADSWIIPRQTNIIIGDGNTINNDLISTGDTTFSEYFIKIGSAEISMVQDRNALSKAVQDSIYCKAGILTTLNGGKQFKPLNNKAR